MPEHRDNPDETVTGVDQLIASYLEAEEAQRVPDLAKFLPDDPSLRSEFFRFLQEHLEIKGARGDKSPLMDPGESSESEEIVKLGEIVGDCKIIRQLGRGGMGIVYLARHVRLNDLRAVKILPRNRMMDTMIKRFWREAQTAASVKHSNVVKIHDVGHTGKLHYIVMEYIEGKTLTQFVEKRGGPLVWEDACLIIASLLDALTSIHENNLVHRDIKPSNIMVSKSAKPSRKTHVVLMDFGLVQVEQAGTQLTMTGMAVGTPTYMAPEQARGEDVDHRADLYSAGATLYFLLSGRSPLKGKTTSVFMQAAAGVSPPSLHSIRTDLPDTVVRIVERAMQATLGKRYDSAERMRQDIFALLKQAKKAKKIALESEKDQPRPKNNPQASTESFVSPKQQDTVASCSDLSHVEANTLVKLEPGTPSGRPLKATPVALMAPSSAQTGVGKWFDEKLWRAATLGMVVVGLLMGIVMLGLFFLLIGGNNSPSDKLLNNAIPDINTEGMVFIPPGMAHLGASENLLRANTMYMDTIKDDPDTLEKYVSNCLEEGERTVALPGFWIDKYEVTNAGYAKFIEATNHSPPPHWNGAKPPSDKLTHPVTQVTRVDAMAYAAWAGKQLSTMEQWMRAFRGDDWRLYPWGDQWNAQLTNVTQNTSFPLGTSPVTATPLDVSPLGVFNLVGNVSEIMREPGVRQGQPAIISKGAHSQAYGDIYGSAPYVVYGLGQDFSNELTGFRCVIEKE